jgi:alpha-tubulin suppressor-like RCC1 family protein
MGDIAANYYDDLVAWQTQENLPEPVADNTPVAINPVTTYDHTCAVKSDTTAWCWGTGADYRLGNNSNANSNTPVQVQKITDGTALTGVIQVTAAEKSACALINNGAVWCWGYNGRYELGDGTLTTRQRAQQNTMTGATSIQATYDDVMAVKSDGSAWKWGFDIVTPTELIPATNILQHDDAADHYCYLQTDRTVWCGGTNYYGENGNGPSAWPPRQVPGFNNAAQVVTGDTYSTCALKTDGTVWCWGWNVYGSAGDGTTTQRNSPVQVPGLIGMTMLSVGGAPWNDDYYCAVKNDGTLWCWGYNGSGQLGNGNTTEQHTPVQAAITNVKELIATGKDFVCAEKNDGTIWCWGEGSNGQLGNGASNDSLAPVQVLNFP